jgi:hypothetical protein
MYVKRITEELSSIYYCRRKIKYYVFWFSVYGLSYAACNAHEQYAIIVSGPSGSIIFYHIIYWRREFYKTSFKQQYVSWILKNPVCNIPSLRRIKQYFLICVHKSWRNVPVILVRC